MKKIAVIIATGSEEIETLTPVDVLRRSGAECVLVSVSGEYPVCSHAVTVKADMLVDEVNFNEFDGIVIPGGMPGATNIAMSKKVIEGAVNMLESGKLLASICASPAVVLANNGIIDGKRVTCFPAPQFIQMLKNCDYTKEDVTVDGNLITANGPKAALEFSFKICEFLGLDAKI